MFEEEKEEEKINIFTVILRVGSIEAGPPLSTILGNFGINTINFVKELNDYLALAPNYFFLRIKIKVYNEGNVNKYEFEVFEPSLYQCIKVVSYKKTLKKFIKGKYEEIVFKVINIDDLYTICIIKFGYVDENILKTVYSIIKSSNLFIFDNFDN